jgi:hypothetical protein
MAANPDSSTSDTLISAPAFTPEMQMANMLGLCEAQMESALHDSDKAVDALIKAFTCMVDATRALSTVTENLPQELKQKMSSDIDGQVAEISKQMGSAVMAFQFYDKLTQRLGHVRYSLSTLALFVCDRNQSNQPEQWKRLLNTLRRLYRTEEERQIFQMIMDGIANDVSPAVALPAVDETKAGEVELF